MIKRTENLHFEKQSLFHLATNMGSRVEDAGFLKVASWFLGPKGENGNLLADIVYESICEHAAYRNSHYKDDPPYIDDGIKQSREYKAACEKLRIIRDDLSKRLHGSVPFFSERYQAHMNWDTVLPASIGYITAMLYNQNNVATEGGPATSVLEYEVGMQLCTLMGFNPKKSWGHITADGTIANLEAMWVARNLKFYPLAVAQAISAVPALDKAKKELDVSVWDSSAGCFVRKPLAKCTTWEKVNLTGDEIIGLRDRITQLCPQVTQDMLDEYIAPYLVQNRGLFAYVRQYPEIQAVRVFVPATKHYSWPKAGTILGLGQDSIVGIQVDDNCRMDITALDAELEKCRKAKIPVLMIVAVIGSTEEGVVDDLKGILTLREKYKELGFLLHCDAAWGGYLRTMITPPPGRAGMLNETESGFIPCLPLSAYAQLQYSLLKNADTLTVDPHKAGFVPYPAGALCYRNGAMRQMIAFNAAYIHSRPEINMGIYGLEGSKPGAAPAAVWMAHQVIPLDVSGYGLILGECTFSAKLYYCYWLTLAGDDDNFRIEPLIPLPEVLYGRQGRIIAQGREQIISRIRENIIGKTNEELCAAESDALCILQQVGSDVLINSFLVNFKVDGKWNTDLSLLNTLNKNLFDKFSITTPEQAVSDDVDFILTMSELDSAHYGVPLKRIVRDLGINVPDQYVMNFLINTILQPWPTTHHFINRIMDIFRHGILECMPKPLCIEAETADRGGKTSSEDLVNRIPGDSTPQPARWYPLNDSYAGFVEPVIGNQLFYWFFRSRCEPDEASPLIIWLNGGPGASSLAGLFLENGPFTLHDDGILVPNPNSWNERAHMLFWDQPVGAGYSHTTTGAYVNSEEELARQFVSALEIFFIRHPEYRNNPVYLTGESYAGKYIPYIGREIKNRNTDKIRINLKGLAIGDGWMLPEAQVYDQIQYAYNLGLVDTLQEKYAQNQYGLFKQQLAAGDMPGAFKTGDDLSNTLIRCGGGENIYDVRSWSDASIQPLKNYLSSRLVKDAIHVPQNIEWKFADAAGPVAEHLINDLMAPVTGLLPELVGYETGNEPVYKFLFYSGNFDMSCGFTGTECILRDLKWKHASEWSSTKRKVWFKNEDNAEKQSLGCIKSCANLTQIEIPMSGHQVPMYQPMISREMIYNWIFDIPFASYDPLTEVDCK